MHDSRAVYEINPLCQSDVLPGFGLSRDRSHPAARLFHQSVDHRALAGVWISDKADADVLFILVEEIELFQKLDQRAFAEWIRNTCLKGESWSGLR